jgi:peptidoglycan/xylan/chitin deacetylase (PgdA/CDA1 family)
MILAYHNIVPAGSHAVGDRSLHLPQREFAAQLDRLQQTHDVITLNEALNSSRGVSPVSDRPRAAITFDDGYAGTLTVGVKELIARGMPATVFVTPSFLDGGSFWWDTYADPVTGLDSTLRQKALSDSRGLAPAVDVLASDRKLRKHELPAFARGASTSELHAALEYEHFTIAAHTWSHPNLATLPDVKLAMELTRPLEWLRQFRIRALPMVSYPYGLSDARVQNAARDAGYTAGFLIDGGWTSTPPQDLFAIPRLNIPSGVSRHGFVLRTAGLIKR